MESSLVDPVTGLEWLVRAIFPEDRYGRNNVLVHDGTEPMVEFYDLRFPMQGEPGQFVSRYYASTLADLSGGLNLDAGVPDWTLSPEAMDEVLGFVADVLESFLLGA